MKQAKSEGRSMAILELERVQKLKVCMLLKDILPNMYMHSVIKGYGNIVELNLNASVFPHSLSVTVYTTLLENAG
jgi:hypothetical protein